MRSARQPAWTAAIAAVVLVAAAPAQATPRLRVTGWTATFVNQQTASSPSGGSLPLCQAIPPVTLAPRLRWSGARPGTDVRVRLTPAGHTARTRTMTLRRARGRAAAVFTARDLRLRADAFEAGRYRLRVRLHGRTLARSTLRLTPGGRC